MSLLALLQAKWIYFGLEAPCFIWIAATGLVLGTLAQLCRLWYLSACEQREVQRLLTHLHTLQTPGATPGQEGLAEPTYQAIAQLFQDAPALWPAWQTFETHLLSQANAAGEPRIWASESAQSVFQANALLAPRLNLGFCAAIPSLVTGLGLLCTFLAILVALLEVRLVDGQFQGLDHLISGLSGKFVSSIAALFAATYFLATERALSHRLQRSVHALASTLDRLIPRLSHTRVLLGLQHDMAAQGRTLQQFHTQVVASLQQGLSDGVGPLLARMSTALEHQQDTLTRTCTGLIQGLEQTMDTTLNATARLLESMQTQLLGSQTTLHELVTTTRQATTEHMALSQTHGEHFATALHGVVGDIQQTTGSSVQHLSTVFATALHELSTRLGALGEHMAQTVQHSAAQAADTAQTVIARADSWSTHSAAQLTQLLAQQQAQVERNGAVQMAFDTSLGQFHDALGQYTSVTGQVRQIATAAASITKVLNDTSATLGRTATMAALQAERFTDTIRRQEDMQQQVAQSLQQYQQVFSQTTQATQDFLGRMEQHLYRYTTLTAQGFDQAVQAADTHLTRAFRDLGATVHDLDGHLRDMAEHLVLRGENS
ncbi:MAG: hypothetical protein FJZ47_11990 [Candidatus Tectomicrobia bacterium]|uniref:MotA/TolQ/ExbB proton channel domain-containing protein n=1 Tax=Tectimicrobiota bacterium TaxID=2528274 RepID=A0A938B2S1_UNCTE|nr:hypothetical protein [Candidatus Tectomicrobia bacterium]